MAAFRLPDPPGDLLRQITAFRHKIKRATRSHSQMMQKSDAAPPSMNLSRAPAIARQSVLIFKLKRSDGCLLNRSSAV